MVELETRNWPLGGGSNRYLTPQQAARAQELFDKYDAVMDIQYTGLSEDDATLYVVWVAGLDMSEARRLVRANRHDCLSYGSFFDYRGECAEEEPQ